MKKLTLAIMILSALFVACGSGAQNKMGGAKGIEISPDKLAIKLDPVCQMPMDQHPISDTITYQGKLYGFCSSGCKEAFAAEPEKFLAALTK